MNWLEDIIDRLLSLLPSIRVVDSTESGVSYWFGKPRLIKSETVVVYLPIICDLDIRTTIKQCIDCQTQAVLTRDGRSISVGVVVQYRVVSPLKAFTEFDNLDTYIPPLAMSACQEVVRHHEVKDIYKISDEIACLLKKKLYNSGVEIINVFVNEVSPCKVIRLITQTPVFEEE